MTLIEARVCGEHPDRQRSTFGRPLAELWTLEVMNRERFPAAPERIWAVTHHAVAPLVVLVVGRHPLVELELTVGLSGVLHRALEARQLDLVLAKRKTGETHGTLVSRDAMAWIAAPDVRVDTDPAEPVPLIACPEPSISRELAIRALERAGRSWRIACTAGSFSGLHSAARAGLGVTAHTRSLIPEGLVELPPEAGLPELGEVEFVLLARGRGESGPGAALARAILATGP